MVDLFADIIGTGVIQVREVMIKAIKESKYWICIGISEWFTGVNSNIVQKRLISTEFLK